MKIRKCKAAIQSIEGRSAGSVQPDLLNNTSNKGGGKKRVAGKLPALEKKNMTK